jgi:hypothetical protein
VKKYTREDFERDLAARQEREAKEKRERQERMEEGARRIWVRDGGSEEAFEKAWPQLRDEARRRRVADADKRAREEMRSSGVSRI